MNPCKIFKGLQFFISCFLAFLRVFWKKNDRHVFHKSGVMSKKYGFFFFILISFAEVESSWQCLNISEIPKWIVSVPAMCHLIWIKNDQKEDKLVKKNDLEFATLVKWCRLIPEIPLTFVCYQFRLYVLIEYNLWFHVLL